MLIIHDHPLLDLACLTTVFPEPLGRFPSPPWLKELLDPTAHAPMASNDTVRGLIRDLLRHGGFKPTGRSKPASEYLIRASQNQIPSINAAVDLCNAISLHSGLPISVVDLDRAEPPLSVGLGRPAESYVFNASGQTIDIAGLLSLRDGQGPCAGPVKDSHRTKTTDLTVRVLTVIWGTVRLPGHTNTASDWWRQLADRIGAPCEVMGSVLESDAHQR